MTFSQYPDTIGVEIAVDGVVDLGEVTFTEVNQLEYFGLQVFSLGVKTNQSMTVRAYNGMTTIGESDAILASALTTTTDNFYGWARFLFNPRLSVPAATAIRFELRLSNYTFSESNWIAAVYDWPVQMAYQSSPDQVRDSSMAIDLYGAT